MQTSWLAFLLLLGCDKLDSALPAYSLSHQERSLSPHTEEAQSEGPSALAPAKLHRLTEARQQLREKWRLNQPAPGKSVSNCKGVAVSEPATQAITISYVDVREQKKSLIPRRIAERLESAGLAQVRGDDSDRSEDVNAEAKTLTAMLDAWSERRYAAVFYVTEFSGPALILRIGELRRSWYPGTLAAQVVLFDTVEQRAICGYSLRTHNDTKDAPIRSRLQADTRMRLERDLASQLVEAARAEFARDLPSVKWP